MSYRLYSITVMKLLHDALTSCLICIGNRMYLSAIKE